MNVIDLLLVRRVQANSCKAMEFCIEAVVRLILIILD